VSGLVMSYCVIHLRNVAARKCSVFRSIVAIRTVRDSLIRRSGYEFKPQVLKAIISPLYYSIQCPQILKKHLL